MKPHARYSSKTGAVVVLAVLMVAGAASAQQGRWLVGLDMISSTIGKNPDAVVVTVDETAPGGALQIGYAVTPSFTLRLYAAGADHPTSDPDIAIRFGGATIDAVFFFREGHRVRPFIFGGLGGFAIESQRANLIYKAEGPGMSLGGGVQAMLGGRVFLHGAVRLDQVNWNQESVTYTVNGDSTTITSPVDSSGSAAKLSLGVGIWL